jgi:pimeloyl-ACP methyl ester carboxylesterase
VDLLRLVKTVWGGRLDIPADRRSNSAYDQSKILAWIVVRWRTMPKRKMQDLIVFLPGITGSVLQSSDGKDIWALSGGALYSWLSSHGDSLHKLALLPHTPGSKPPDDGVRAVKLMPDFHGVFGLWKIDGYHACTAALAQTFQFENREGDPSNFITFPYDWRRSNRESAAELKLLVDEKLQQWRTFSHFKNAKVILLAHSMGGLVSRYYLEVFGGWRDCRALITFGTPYWGAVDAIDYVINGYKQKFVDLTNVLRSFPSVYELMACYDVVRVHANHCGENTGGAQAGHQGQTSGWKKVAHAGPLPHLDTARAVDALAFHDEIAAAVAKNRESADYCENRYKIVPMIGVRQATMQSIVMESGAPVGRELRPPSVDVALEGGDGRVPRVSAAPIEIFGEYRESFFVEQHGSLQNNPQLIDDLLERLSQMQANKPVRGTFEERSIVKPAAIALRVEDLYLSDEPIRVEVELKDRGERDELLVTIEGVTNQAAKQNFEIKSSEGGATLEIGTLEPGRYRVTVQAKDGYLVATPVHDVFEVAFND